MTIISKEGWSDGNSRIFGVEEGGPPYRLRQARYYDLGQNVAQWAWEHHQKNGEPSNLLDVGTNDGVLRRYTEIQPGSEYVRYNAVDIYPQGREFVYKHEDWTHHHADLNQGMTDIPSESYDIVVCEQVLEHLTDYRLAMSELARVLRPGGKLVVGVPVFPEGLHLVRKHVIPVTDKILKVRKVRGHIQAWSKRTFVHDLKLSCPEIEIERIRGFRIISGGILRPLEYCRWWWRLNRQLGQLLPSLCVEIQVIAQKKEPDVSLPQRRNEPLPEGRRAA